MVTAALAGSLTVAMLPLLATSASAQSTGEQAAFVANDAQKGFEGTDLLTPENTLIERSSDGLVITVKIPTPEPGSYTYPEEIPAERYAAPEAFSGWAFVFNHPEFCVTSPEPPRCGGEDFNDQVKFGI
jgi:hypothetical protein